MKQRKVKILHFKKEHYERLVKALQSVGARWPRDYDEWLKNYEREISKACAEGSDVEILEIDADEFLSHCNKRMVPADQLALDMFAAEKLLRKWNRENPGSVPDADR